MYKYWYQASFSLYKIVIKKLRKKTAIPPNVWKWTIHYSVIIIIQIYETKLQLNWKYFLTQTVDLGVSYLSIFQFHLLEHQT